MNIQWMYVMVVYNVWGMFRDNVQFDQLIIIQWIFVHWLHACCIGQHMDSTQNFGDVFKIIKRL